jgi:hypothetical protein
MNDLFCRVTGISINFPYQDYVRASIDLLGNDLRIIDQFRHSMHNPFSGLRLMDDEYMCMWCGSPNPLTNRHCSQCGGARGFIIK